MEHGGNNSAIIAKAVPFHFQQGLFHLQASLKPPQCVIRTDGTMAWDNNRKGIRCQGIANCPGCVRHTKILPDSLVGTNSPYWNPEFSQQNRSLKSGTAFHIYILQRKFDLVSIQKP